MNINDLTKLVMEQAKEKGFGINQADINVGAKIASVHSEVSEAYEAYRRKDMDGEHGFKQELGDAVQRILHLCGILGIDIEQEILTKNPALRNKLK